MKKFSILLVLAGGIAAGCFAPQVRLAPASPAIWHDTGTPSGAAAPEREVRHYRDERGVLWDDRGRKVDGPS